MPERRRPNIKIARQLTDQLGEDDMKPGLRTKQADKDFVFDRSRHKEQAAGGFGCGNCEQWVSIHKDMGTQHRNHCNHCLWSKHVDEKPGDRKSECQSRMEPIGVTLRHEGNDKYGHPRLGEVMLVHKCLNCSTHNLNRIAADDDNDVIVKVFEESQHLPPEEQETLKREHIDLLGEDQKGLLMQRLFGKGFNPQHDEKEN